MACNISINFLKEVEINNSPLYSLCIHNMTLIKPSKPIRPKVYGTYCLWYVRSITQLGDESRNVRSRVEFLVFKVIMVFKET